MQIKSADDGNQQPNPFIVDATSHPDISKVPLVNTTSVTNFLSDGLLGVASEKGVGKTHLLRLKSKHLRDTESSDSIWIPRTELCEQFDRVTYAFTSRSANIYADPESWKVLWATAIASVILTRANIAIPEILQNIYLNDEGSANAGTADGSDYLTIESCLLALLKSDIEQYRLLYPTRLKNLITNRIERQVGVFIDSIDEAFDKHVGETLWDVTMKARGSGRQGVVKESIWISAQLGLIAAARDLNRANRRVGVYFAVRREALQANRSVLALQEESLIQELHYSAETVKRIFMSRVSAIPKARLAAPEETDELKRFLGFTHIPHWRVRDAEGNPPQEEAFAFLYRHTFGRIREVLELGRIIYEMDPKERSPDAVRQAVDQAAGRLFEVYKREMIPFWDRHNEVVFEHINSNVLTQRRLDSIWTKVRDLIGTPDHPFCYLYARGLLGRVTEDKAGGAPKIEFVRPGMYLIEKNQHLPACPHYFLHPCLESTIRERSQTFQIDHRVIVGDSAVCEIPEDSGALTIRWKRRDNFSFIYRGIELRHLSPTGGAIYAQVFAIIAITAATKEQIEVTVDDMVATAQRLITARLISAKLSNASKQDLLEILRRMDKTKDDTGKTYRRDIVEKLKQSLAEVSDHLPNDSGDAEPTNSYLSYQNGLFHWLMCDPSQINIVEVTRHLAGKRLG